MATDTRAARAESVPILGTIERAAWRIPLPSRRLFLAVASTLVGALVASSLAAAWVAARNADTISGARETGLEIARNATEFRTNLAAADAEAASTLISGSLEDPDSRGRYETNLLEASQALTAAALVATDDDTEDIEALSDGLLRYAGLVETARANSRQGFPVGASYLTQARQMAQDDMVPRAERLRRVGEQRVAKAANSVGGPIAALAVGVLVVALLVLLAATAVLAGRTRHVTHPAVLAATLVIVAALVVVTAGLARQGSELRAAATTDIDAYVAANDAAFALSSLRVTEIGAVAAHGSGAPLYQQFHEDADTLVAQLSEDETASELLTSVRGYTEAVDEVEATDTGGDNLGAADITLDGDSATGFQEADEQATAAVDAAASDLGERFDAASNADIPPLLPIVLGFLAAGLAAAGTLARGRRYR